MRVEVHVTGRRLEPAALQGVTAVVVDVLRATSTIVEALANGARAVYPTENSEEAIRLATSLGREDTLLCGERRGLKIEGYDLGNSPGEFTPERVGDRALVMTTTNGTPALLSAAAAERTFVASFLNLHAVSRRVTDAEALTVVCAGREGRLSLDDVVCAGAIVRDLVDRRSERGDVEAMELDDGARAALTLADSVSVDPSFLQGTEAGRALVELGLRSDLELCADVDRHPIVPEMEDRTIRAD